MTEAQAGEMLELLGHTVNLLRWVVTFTASTLVLSAFRLGKDSCN